MRSLSKVCKGLALGLAMTLLVGAKSPRVGEMAPPFQLTLMDGSKVTSNELRGQVVVLNFWATWCVPCRTELPTLDAYYEARKTRGLKVYAITTEDSVPLYQLKKLFAVLHIQPTRKVKGGYDIIEGVPTNYIIDRTGRIRYAKAAAFDLQSLNAIVGPLLDEPAPAPAPAPAG